MTEKGPIYGVELIEKLPVGESRMMQQMPSQVDLERANDRNHVRLVAGYEVLLDHWRNVCERLKELQDGKEESSNG